MGQSASSFVSHQLPFFTELAGTWHFWIASLIFSTFISLNPLIFRSVLRVAPCTDYSRIALLSAFLCIPRSSKVLQEKGHHGDELGAYSNSVKSVRL